jgi:hypothetical protein
VQRNVSTILTDYEVLSAIAASQPRTALIQVAEIHAPLVS